MLATLGASSSPQSSPSCSVGLAAEDAEMRADEAVLLLSRSVGVVCAHLGHQHDDGGHDDHHPSLSRQPLALLCHLCSEFIGLDLVKRTDLDEEVDDDDLSLLEGSEMLRVPGPHDPSAAAGMDFSVMSSPLRPPGCQVSRKQSLEEWDVLDLPERRERYMTRENGRLLFFFTRKRLDWIRALMCTISRPRSPRSFKPSSREKQKRRKALSLSFSLSVAQLPPALLASCWSCCLFAASFCPSASLNFCRYTLRGST